MQNISLRQTVPLVALAAVFVAASFLAHRYEWVIGGFVRSGGAYGAATFIALTSVFVIFVIPLDIAFLIPVGTAVWGPIPTALLSITGWTLGAAVAFGIARNFGAPVVEKLIGLKRVRIVENRIPKQNLFWMVVLLRMLVSVDILSYALGLFSHMRWRDYIIATAIGVAPFGFFFAFAATLPFWYQIAAIALAVGLATLIVWRYQIPREP